MLPNALQLIFYIFLSCTLTLGCKSSHKKEDKNSDALASDDNTRDIEKILSLVKAYPLEPDVRGLNEDKAALGLVSFGKGFREFLEFTEHKKLDSKATHYPDSRIGKIKSFIDRNSTESQTKLWNNAFDDWSKGKKYDPQENDFLIPDYDIISKVLSSRKDLTVIASLESVQQGKGMIIKDQKGEYSFLYEKIDGDFEIFPLKDFNEENMIIVNTQLDSTTSNPIYAMLINNFDNANKKYAFTGVSSILGVKDLQRNFEKNHANIALGLILEKNRMNLNRMINFLEESRKNQPEIYPEDLIKKLNEISGKRNIDKELEQFDITALNTEQKNALLIFSTIGGQLPLVKKLIDSPGIVLDELISAASSYGQANTLKFLLSKDGVSPAANNNIAIRMVNNKDVAELLLKDKRVDPTAVNNTAIRRAIAFNNKDILELFLKDERVIKTLTPDIKTEIRARFPDIEIP